MGIELFGGIWGISRSMRKVWWMGGGGWEVCGEGVCLGVGGGRGRKSKSPGLRQLARLSQTQGWTANMYIHSWALIYNHMAHFMPLDDRSGPVCTHTCQCQNSYEECNLSKFGWVGKASGSTGGWGSVGPGGAGESMMEASWSTGGWVCGAGCGGVGKGSICYGCNELVWTMLTLLIS